jgi:adhesin/invasin
MNKKIKTIALSAAVTLALGLSFVANAQTASEMVDSLKNKAADATESFVNGSLNDFANQFGEGNTEVSIRKINGNGNETDYSIITTQPLTSLGEDGARLFWQGSLGSYDQNGDRRTTVNLGIGKRWLSEDEKSFTGINSFYDYEFSAKHKRMSLGGEYKRSNAELSVNKYWGISDKHSVGGTDEEALDGYDAVFKGQLPYLPWANLVAKKYHWDRTNQDDVDGDYFGVEAYLTSQTKLEIGKQDDNYMNRETYAKLTHSFGANSDHASLSDSAIATVAYQDGESMKNKMLNKVERSNKIVVEFGGITVSRAD